MITNEESIALLEVYRIKALALEAIRCLKDEEAKNETLLKENKKLKKSLRRLQDQLASCQG